MKSVNENRDKCRRPIMHMQNLDRGRQPTGELNRSLAKEDKPRGVIFIRLAAFTIDAGSVKKRIAANEEQLDAAIGVTLHEFSDVVGVAYADIERNSGLFLSERGVFPDLTIVR